MSRQQTLVLTLFLCAASSLSPRFVNAGTLSSPSANPSEFWADHTSVLFSVKYSDPLGQPPLSVTLFLIHPNKQKQEIPLDVSHVPLDAITKGVTLSYRLPPGGAPEPGMYYYYFEAESAGGKSSIGSSQAPFHSTAKNLWLSIALNALVIVGAWIILFLLYQYVLMPHCQIGRIPAVATWTVVADLAVAGLVVAYMLAAPVIWIPIAITAVLLIVLLVIMT